MRFIDHKEVVRNLTYPLCTPLVREAMIALSCGQTKQLLRSFLPLEEGQMLGIMPGALAPSGVFGAKLISVFPQNALRGRQTHQGLVVLFDGESGAAVCVVDAGAITSIRTAAASAAATDALARTDAERLTILGYGHQAEAHIRAISQVRHLSEVRIWGRDTARAEALALRIGTEIGVIARAVSEAKIAVADADIICTVTGSGDPVLQGAWVPEGSHVNLVGSSHARSAEADNEFVSRSRFIADSREGVLVQGGEFLRAKESGIVNDDHVVGEIGQVFRGDIEGRQTPRQITAYKSLGHIVQDLAAAQALWLAGNTSAA